MYRFILPLFTGLSLLFADICVAETLTPMVNLTTGAKHSLSSEISGKARVWIFLSAKCPCSDSHIQKLKETAAAFSSHGFEFLGVHSNQDESESLAESYFKKQALGFPVYHDDGAVIANRFQALKTPHIFVETSDHRILYEGALDDSKRAQSTDANFLRDALQEVEAGKAVTRSRTKSLGCVISRKKES